MALGHLPNLKRRVAWRCVTLVSAQGLGRFFSFGGRRGTTSRRGRRCRSLEWAGWLSTLNVGELPLGPLGPGELILVFSRK